jgi:hypothetical protein
MTLSGPTVRRWRRSNFSTGTGNDNCVEIAVDERVVAVRDSKNAGGSVLGFSPAAWRPFLLRIR